MSYTEILMLAIALSVDASVVSFSFGILPLSKPVKESFLLAFITGGFQFLMPILGYTVTSFALEYISPYSKIIIFTIFTILGLKIIIEAFKSKKEKKLCINLLCLLMIGIGTSIDAFSGGISLKLCGNSIVPPSALIGMTTFIMSLGGFYTGKIIKRMPIIYLEIISGIILISLGLKALI